MGTEETNQIVGAITSLADATTKITHGTTSGPTGLEMLAMAISGNGGEDGSVSSALNNIANAIDGLTEAVRDHQ